MDATRRGRSPTGGKTHARLRRPGPRERKTQLPLLRTAQTQFCAGRME